MKKSIGSIPMYTLVAVFLMVIFAFMAGLFSYYKAFKLNGKVTSLIERCEGKSTCYEAEIDRLMNNYSYTVSNDIDCPQKDGVNGDKIKPGICIYYFDNEGTSKRYSYGVITFMTMDLPIIHTVVKLPIFSKTDRLYKF